MKHKRERDNFAAQIEINTPGVDALRLRIRSFVVKPINGFRKRFLWAFSIGVVIFVMLNTATYVYLFPYSVIFQSSLGNIIMALIVLTGMNLCLARILAHIIHLCLVGLFDCFCATGLNSEETSLRHTMEVIDKARKWIIFYDYGEKLPQDASGENLYMSEDVAEALIDKLDAGDKTFLVSIILSNNRKESKDLTLLQALNQWKKENKRESHRVLIDYGIDRADYPEYNQRCPKIPYHYKINDRCYAYLTQHKRNSAKRKYFYYKRYLGNPRTNISDCIDFHKNILVK